MVEFTSYLLGIAGLPRVVCSGGVYVHVMCIPRENECVHVATSHLLAGSRRERCQAMRAKFTASDMSVPV